MKLHLSLIEKQEEDLKFYIDKEANKILIKKEFPKSEVYYYSSLFSLFFKIRNEKKFFAHELFLVLTIHLLKLFKERQIYFWVQGIFPYESFMRNKSKIRFVLLSFLEKKALKVSDYKIFVSDSMRRHYEKEYKISLKEHYIIVPCKSEFYYNETIKDKYSFVYIGGMSVWQKVEDTIQLFKKIRNSNANATLDLITLSTDEAKKMVEKEFEGICPSFIQIYSVKERGLIPDILSKFEFGFLLRDENSVNQVSSPIKFAEYLSCGVNVICSNAIPHYASLIKKHNCGYSVSKDFQLPAYLEHSTKNALRAYKENFSEELFTRRYKSIL